MLSKISDKVCLINVFDGSPFSAASLVSKLHLDYDKELQKSR